MHLGGHLRMVAIILMVSAGCARSFDTWEDVAIVCPAHCVCQRAHLKDLSIARWTGGLNAEIFASTWHLSEAQPLHNHNEVAYADDDDPHGDDNDNPLLKQTMCMLPDKSNVKDVLLSLPPDVQALVLLYNNGADKNITIHASELLDLNDLLVLELRSTNPLALRFVLDQPLPAVRYASFETIDLIGTRAPTELASALATAVHPSELFDYVPESERTTEYNVTIAIDTEPIIVPFEVYQMEQKIAKMASFSGWAELFVLRVHSCRLAELHWQMFDGLQRLEHLSLEANGIKTVPPFALFGAPHLKTLSLAGNAIEELNYRALAGLLRLERLDLSDNRMELLSEVTFPPFPKLQTLDLRNNPIRRVLPMTFGVMNGTRHVHIGSKAQAFELSDGEVFRSLGALRTLTIANATRTTLGQAVFRGLRGVQSLRVHGRVQRIEFDAFAEMVSVRELVLSACALELISMDTFFGTRDLEVVDLSENRLAALPFGLFDGQAKLKEVYLQGNRLTELPGDVFNGAMLRLMRLTDNPWSCACTMTAWKQSVTNAARRGRINQRCVTDLSMAGGRRMRCNDNTNQFEYAYDMKLTPRCGSCPAGHADCAGRGVYYTMRKTLNCAPVKRAVSRRQPAMAVGKKAPPPPTVEQRKQQLKKLRQLQSKQNELHFQLHRQRKAQAEQQRALRARGVQESNDMDNDLLA